MTPLACRRFSLVTVIPISSFRAAARAAGDDGDIDWLQEKKFCSASN
jgi:hypothetical protein